MDSENKLFSSIKIGEHTAKNRIVINAMECCDADLDGNPSDITYQRYENLFKGDPGMIFLEAITITYESIARIHQLSILPKNITSLKKFVEHLKKINNKPLFIFQLTHSGELSNPKFSKQVTVKPLPGYGGELLSEDDIKHFIKQFVEASKIVHDIGADGVDLKLCHGYLGSQLLRPWNDRKWKYGGPWENRSRFAYELIESVFNAINDPKFLIGSKISMWEGFPGGFGTSGPRSGYLDMSEPIDLAKGLEERGAHYIMQSAGSPSLTLALTQPDKRIPDYVYLHHYFSKILRDNLKPGTVVIGSAYSIFSNGKNNLRALEPEEKTLLYWANKNIREGIVDMVALGRQSLADPLIPIKLITGKEDEINWCTACDSCIEFLIRQSPVGCAIYNKYYRDSLRNIRQQEGKLKEKRT
ncbi:MAG: 2,4-dienoyl-CoA reductase [Cyanobacteria bacterium]|nr:2,4-dienoyl-CoA reductase [Cyanobacteriota bacterium]